MKSKVNGISGRWPKALGNLGLSPIMLIVFVVVAGLPLFTDNPFTLRLFITAFMTATLAMGFDFTNGYIGICNFGYAAFWGVGAYTSAILVKDFHVPLPLGLLGAVALTAVMGALIGCLTIRLGGISCTAGFGQKPGRSYRRRLRLQRYLYVQAQDGISALLLSDLCGDAGYFPAALAFYPFHYGTGLPGDCTG